MKPGGGLSFLIPHEKDFVAVFCQQRRSDPCCQGAANNRDIVMLATHDSNRSLFKIAGAIAQELNVFLRNDMYPLTHEHSCSHSRAFDFFTLEINLMNTT